MRLADVLRYIVIGGVFLLPLLPFVVTDSMFFPFITGKNFAFRIVTEVIFGAWILLALLDTRYRPSFSWLLVAVTAFVAIIGIADLFGENIFKSFWSNFERMEGWVTLLHLFMYFLVVSSALTTRKLWGWLAHTSVGVSVLISLYGIGQFIGAFAIHQSDVRLDATIGNSAYLAVYLVFHIFITLVLMLRFRGSGWIRYLYLLPVVLQTFVLYHTATRGAILGFIGGVFLTALLLSIFEHEQKALRRSAIAGVLAVLVLAGGFFALKDASFVQESPVLSRFASISLTESTTLSRFTIWGMALEGAKERPLLGYGQENFNLVFNKHFEPVLYDHEPWFDRVHNVILDWMIAGGILGLLAYLFIPLAFLYHLWHRNSRVYFGVAERSLWTGLLAAYFFHNLFVFDNVLSYLLFFSVLAYVQAQVGKPFSEQSLLGRPYGAGMVRAATPFVIVLMIASFYYFNWQGLLSARALLVAVSAQSVEERIAAFERASSYDALGRQEVAEQATQFAVQIASQDVPIELKQSAFSIAETEMQEEVAYAPDDARLRLFMGALYDRYGNAGRATEEYEQARTLSPNKQAILQQLAFNYIARGQHEAALSVLREAFELASQFDALRISYAVGYLYAGEQARADELLAGVQKETSIVNSDMLLNVYAELGLYGKARDIWEARVERTPSDAQTRLSLAAVYVELGERALAVQEIEKVIELNPDFRAQGGALIEEIRAGAVGVEEVAGE